MALEGKDYGEIEEEIEDERKEIESYHNQWKDISTPLIDKVKCLQEQVMQKHRKKIHFINAIEETKRLIHEKNEEITVKQASIDEMKKKMNNDFPPSRSFYTKRIIDQVNDVRRQDVETKRVLFDIKQLQKEINSLTEKVQRAYAITDEVIFKDAKNSEWNRRCYKLLATFHKDYDNLLDCINEVGAIRRDILQLKGTVGVEKDSKILPILDRIQQDLKELKEENNRLESEKVS